MRFIPSSASWHRASGLLWGLVAATMLGYNASLQAAQTPEVALNMRYLVAAMYLLGAVVQLIAYGLVFNLNKKTMAQIESDLAARKNAQ